MAVEGLAGCCAATSYYNVKFDKDFVEKTGFAQVTFIWVPTKETEQIAFAKEIGAKSIIEIGETTLITIDNETASKLKNKKYFEEHERLQKRDGREPHEFKDGDCITMISAPGAYKDYAFTAGPESTKALVYVYRKDTYYGTNNRQRYGQYPAGNWLRVEKH